VDTLDELSVMPFTCAEVTTWPAAPAMTQLGKDQRPMTTDRGVSPRAFSVAAVRRLAYATLPRSGGEISRCESSRWDVCG
jgi:hypothetical protein